MEANKKEQLMKMTKANIIAEYITSILAVESKDNEINNYKGQIAELRAQIKKLNTENIPVHQSEPIKTKDSEATIKENANLKSALQMLNDANLELKILLGEMIDMMESNFQHLSSSVNNNYNGFNLLRNRILRTIPKEEGNK